MTVRHHCHWLDRAKVPTVLPPKLFLHHQGKCQYREKKKINLSITVKIGLSSQTSRHDCVTPCGSYLENTGSLESPPGLPENYCSIPTQPLGKPCSQLRAQSAEAGGNFSSTTAAQPKPPYIVTLIRAFVSQRLSKTEYTLYPRVLLVFLQTGPVAWDGRQCHIHFHGEMTSFKEIRYFEELKNNSRKIHGVLISINHALSCSNCLSGVIFRTSNY